MSQKADKFYEQKWLMVHFGFIPWKKYIADAKLRMFLAENHCKVKFFLFLKLPGKYLNTIIFLNHQYKMNC